jgi:hypothetical protein
MRFNWEQKSIDRLKTLVSMGLRNPELAEILSKEFNAKITPISVHNARSRYALIKNLISIDNEIDIYEEPQLPNDNYMISCDYHAPYHSEIWVNRLLGIADKFEIRKNVIIGDLFDMDFAKWALFKQAKDEGEEESSLDKEVAHVEPIVRALDYFDNNELITGNHEFRIDRLTGGAVQGRHIMRLFWGDDFARKIKVSPYDKVWIGEEWLLVHPRSYSQISGSVAVRLAEKYHCNIINAHGHFVALRYDRSGQYMGIDLGGMFKISKIEYINKKTTTHPFWNNGFGMIYNGKFYHFHKNSDWDYWLGG